MPELRTGEYGLPERLSYPAKEKHTVTTQLSGGEVDFAIGTHALIAGEVEYANLGLVITDEQHRFGVMQRAALSGKGAHPHTLVMSATPIPRTLALILYGDLEVSVIDQLPPGRRSIATYAVPGSYRPRVYAFLRKLVAEGRQVYIVCPMVEENDELPDERKAVTAYARMLREEVFPDLRVVSVHGKMKPREKEAVMTAFAAHDADILVATTVIEVGVDVPNAAVMVIENAERFGLSQLHQLRGLSLIHISGNIAPQMWQYMILLPFRLHLDDRKSCPDNSAPQEGHTKMCIRDSSTTAPTARVLR